MKPLLWQRRKKFVSVLLVNLMMYSTLLDAQPLIYRGSAEMPAEILLVEADNFLSGDTIYSAYELDGRLYASWKQPAVSGNFFVRIMADDHDTPLITGMSTTKNTVAVYVLFRNGKFTRLNVEKIQGNSHFTMVKMSDTGMEVVLHDNPYYSLCPVWPEITTIVTTHQVRSGIPEPFYKWLNINEIIPKYARQIHFEITTGNGKLHPSAFHAHTKYTFHPEDYRRGFIDLKIVAEPLKNCINCDCERAVRVYLSEP